MDRLQSELARLYLPPLCASADSNPAAHSLIDERGMVRAMVLDLARPADWDELSWVWTGVQADLDLPAPAIAVSGADGLQLWFSLAQAVPAIQAHTFLEALRSRYLAEVAGNRITLMPAPDPARPGQFRVARMVPALHAQTSQWSAFVSSDLAPVFADTPWMDIQPGNEAQAGVLKRLLSIPEQAFTAALSQLNSSAPEPSTAIPETASPESNASMPAPQAQATDLNPKQFLLQVMNDSDAPLNLRIEAAKALLPYGKHTE